MTVVDGDHILSEVCGECPDCHYSYVPGSLIRLESGRWRHARCPNQQEATA